MKKILVIMLLLATNAFAANVTDTITVPTGDAFKSNYYVNYRATLATGGLLSNVEISVANPHFGARRISKFFKGPGSLSAQLLSGSHDALELVFTNASGRIEASTVKRSTLVGEDCIVIRNTYQVCIEERATTESGFGGNLTDLKVTNLTMPSLCEGASRSYKSALSLHPAKINKRFALYYQPDTYEAYNVDPIQSLKVVTSSNGRELLEIQGTHGVYERYDAQNQVYDPYVEPQLKSEYLDIKKFEDLEYSEACLDDGGPLGG